MAHDLRFTAAMIGLATIATSISKLFTQRQAGELADRFGPERIQLVSMLLIPALPLTWLFITALWQVVVLNLVGGVFWGAFELVSFNYLLTFLPPERQARYSAIYQVVVAMALAGGAVAGAGIIARWGYKGIFIASASGRILAALAFLAMVRAFRRPTSARLA
jgi:putative MFS transporter